LRILLSRKRVVQRRFVILGTSKQNVPILGRTRTVVRGTHLSEQANCV
jgi:hypothetical protein